MPERITRYTLRPYVSGGLGLMRVHIEDVLDISIDPADVVLEHFLRVRDMVEFATGLAAGPSGSASAPRTS